jgi:hypothetical protein
MATFSTSINKYKSARGGERWKICPFTVKKYCIWALDYLFIETVKPNMQIYKLSTLKRFRFMKTFTPKMFHVDVQYEKKIKTRWRLPAYGVASVVEDDDIHLFSLLVHCTNQQAPSHRNRLAGTLLSHNKNSF